MSGVFDYRRRENSAAKVTLSPFSPPALSPPISAIVGAPLLLSEAHAILAIARTGESIKPLIAGARALAHDDPRGFVFLYEGHREGVGEGGYNTHAPTALRRTRRTDYALT